MVIALTFPNDFRNADYVVLGALGLTAFWYVVGVHWRLRRGTAGVRVLPASTQAESAEPRRPVGPPPPATAPDRA